MVCRGLRQNPQKITPAFLHSGLTPGLIQRDPNQCGVWSLDTEGFNVAGCVSSPMS